MEKIERVVTVPFMVNTIDAKVGLVVEVEEYPNLNLSVKVFHLDKNDWIIANAGFVNKQWLFMHTKSIDK